MRVPKIKLKHLLRKLFSRKRRPAAAPAAPAAPAAAVDDDVVPSPRDSSVRDRDEGGVFLAQPTGYWSFAASALAAPPGVIEGRREDHHHQQEIQPHPYHPRYQQRPGKSCIKASSRPEPEGSGSASASASASASTSAPRASSPAVSDEKKQSTTSIEKRQQNQEEQQQREREREREKEKEALLEPEECPICRDAVGVRNPEGVTEGWAKLPCGHRFGANCLRTWLQASLDRGQHVLLQCPICRVPAHSVATVAMPSTAARWLFN